MPLVYLCGPILGQSYKEARYGWRLTAAKHLRKCEAECLSPMRQEDHLSVLGSSSMTIDNVKTGSIWAEDRMVFQKDVLDIRRCDLLLANFLGAEAVSKGSVCEIGMAYALDKPIVVAMEDDNPHRHPFITVPAVAVLPTLQEALDVTGELLKTGV